MQTVEIINFIIICLFFVCYSYQFLYIPVALAAPKKSGCAGSTGHTVAVLIAARNEQAVIGELIDSIRAQAYPQELVDIFVGADNCTDRTADIACGHGAYVFECRRREGVGKGDVLNFILRNIDLLGRHYDAYI